MRRTSTVVEWLGKVAGLAVALLTVVAALAVACGDDDNEASTPSSTRSQSVAEVDDASSRFQSVAAVDETHLSLEIYAATASYLVTAELPPAEPPPVVGGEQLIGYEWEIQDHHSGDHPSVSEINLDRWVIGKRGTVISLYVYDLSDTEYETPTADSDHREFVESIVMPAEGLIGNTEEVDVPGGFPAFDFLLVWSEAVGEASEASMFVIFLDGSTVLTIEVFNTDESGTAAAESTYTSIIETIAVSTV